MARFLITTKRQVRADGDTVTAVAAAGSETGVTVVSAADPHMATIETTDEIADRLRQKFAGTHFVEREIRRGLT